MGLIFGYGLTGLAVTVPSRTSCRDFTGGYRICFQDSLFRDWLVGAGYQLATQPGLWARLLVLLHVASPQTARASSQRGDWIPRSNIPRKSPTSIWLFYSANTWCHFYQTLLEKTVIKKQTNQNSPIFYEEKTQTALHDRSHFTK